METSRSPIHLIALCVGSLALISAVVAFSVRPERPTLREVFLSALPAILMPVLFYSLALHMHLSLGQWPYHGEIGFSKPLLIHSGITHFYFIILYFIGSYLWSILFLVSCAFDRFKGYRFRLGIFGGSCLVCFGIMMLA